jgi:hypothetical protein
LDSDVVQEYEGRIRLLEARNQTLTEDKDIATKELEVTNCWYDNQQQLIQAAEAQAEEKA